MTLFIVAEPSDERIPAGVDVFVRQSRALFWSPGADVFVEVLEIGCHGHSAVMHALSRLSVERR
jgi:hypothetical protein